jgi:tRNA threonylcarbamoyladenosine biosynthesis protein TsaB
VSFILNVDTAVESASICLAENGRIISTFTNPSRNDHAAWLHSAIHQILDQTKTRWDQLDALAISAGPGSYTGLRVGMSAVKGICYALKLPMIAINTLQMMAAAAQNEEAHLLCPMIDARRMEVFTAVFDRNLEEVVSSTNLILSETIFSDLWEKDTICFFGNGSAKMKPLMRHPNVFFSEIDANAGDMAVLSYLKFNTKQFEDLAYTQPFYGKEFYSTLKQSL